MKDVGRRMLLASVLWLAAAVVPAIVQAAEPPRRIDAAAFEKIAAEKGQGSDSERLRRLFDLFWDYTLQETPEIGTFIGDPRHQDRWSDLSAAANERSEAETREMLEALLSIDREKLAERERTDYDLLRKKLESRIEGFRFPSEALTLNQMGGIQQGIPQVLTYMRPTTVEGYQAVLSRLREIPTVVDQMIARLEKGLAQGVTPPRITLRDVPGQVQALIVDDPMTSPMLTAFKEMPRTIPADERERMTREAVRAYQERVVPSLRKLHRYLADTYLPGAREEIAATALPDGEAWYAWLVRETTTTDLAPKQIHEIGLAEVKRIREEMDEVIRSTGFKGSFAEFLTFLRTDPRFYFEKPEDLVTAYREICKKADPELVKLFGRLPRLPYGVDVIPEYAAKSQTTAYYNQGSLAAGRPGMYSVNTYDLKSRPRYEMEALSLHEAVPGHHLQVSLAQEIEGIPTWRRYDDYTVYVEGWGLYAESLGEEMGFYQDPYSKFGQLTYEMWRAVRLVVDTGIHSMGWSRQQAIDYFKANAGKTEHDIIVEIDRYIVTPGQALAYKLGELKIKELRAFAEKELGAKFDVRAFHDEVLGRGALPLDLLEKNVRGWVAGRK
ncbi:MAG TPA: DUF885 domain-containing protein [Thermoanaerobaculia bacterium]|nr:DUF885 domain-containing protein [Thermoanaerobaculia bacterium]